jgi:aspartate carbamoyltransferase regulatory subunit
MLKIEPIENGTVIDHIKSGKGKKVLEMLGIDESYAGRTALVMNVVSKRCGKKDIVKIEGKEVSEELSDIIALISPGSTINIIKNGKVSVKRDVSVPEALKNIGTCPNPNCITNFERAEKSFVKEDGGYRCHYCERIFEAEELI